MPTYDLGWILPHVRKSLRGRGNLSYDSYMEGLWEVLHQAGEMGLSISEYLRSVAIPKE